ncbi:MAG: hypothetical protein HYT39_02290 [Candidatus Sungbacteria bacterium]|nr:hypothetical protein [Candidatus Sungbacteria bacterium]
MALLEFYGDSCPHCVKMAPLVEKLKSEGIEIEGLEVWQNEDNAKKMAELDKGLCGGVPFFYNTETKTFLCGEASWEDLKAWATNK